ncbi:MAG: glycosyltransferase [Lachnospiraceae bacterium]|nr:glycosyltransferase [Lachnospiraceae bacterium]
MVKISVIICTLNREKLLDRCVESIFMQQYSNYEIIIVDQSEKINNTYLQNGKVKYVHINQKGLSNARNVGLRIASGEWIALADDDAIYNENFLSNAVDSISYSHEKIGIVSGAGIDPDTGAYLISKMKKKSNKEIGWNTLFSYVMSAGMVIEKSLLNDGFDTRFGVGTTTEYGSGEETDIVIKALILGKKVYFNPNMQFMHKADLGDNKLKIYSYNCGKGALLKKYYIGYNKFIFGYIFITVIIRSLLGCVLYIIGNKKCYKSFWALWGKLHGFRSFNI